MNFIKFSNLAIPVILILVLGSCIYTAITGQAVGTDTNYNTLGRILTGAGGVVVAIFMVWTFRTNRQLDKSLAEEKERRRRDADQG